MAAAPLSHHEILPLVEAFARRGRPLDLAATDRAARRLAFRPIDHPAAGPSHPALHETLSLESLGTGTCRLTRTLRLPGGLAATLQAQGSDPARLLALIEAVDPRSQFRVGPGFVIARSHWVDALDRAGTAPGRRILTGGEIELDGLRLTLRVSPVKGVSADITLTPAAGTALALPQDLLAVLGWNWARLLPGRGGWTSKLRLRGDNHRRSLAAEQALYDAAALLAQTLAEAPALFHDRHRAARWGVVLRRAIPLLTPVALLVAVLTLPRVDAGANPGLWWLLFHIPTVLIAASFCLQELPQLEIPPLPRRSRLASWRSAVSAPPAPSPAGAATWPGKAQAAAPPSAT